MTSDVEMLREALIVARSESERAWRENGKWIADHSDDPEIVHRIDRCLILHANVKALERLIAQEIAG